VGYHDHTLTSPVAANQRFKQETSIPAADVCNSIKMTDTDQATPLSLLVAGLDPSKAVSSSPPSTDPKPGPSSTAPPEPKDFAVAFPSNLPVPPFIHVHGVPNFRDLGGYECPALPDPASSVGKKFMVRPGLLYRCAHPTHLTPQGAEVLTTQLEVKDIYDLRAEPEILRLASSIASSSRDVYPLASAETGCIDVAGVRRNFTPVYPNEDYGPVALAKKLAWYTAAQDAVHHTHGYRYSDGFVQAYRDIAIHGAKSFIIIFRHILERPDEPLVFHCTAGKDRTGVFGALVLRLCGVDDETLCWEYALTEPGLGSWREMFIERISAGGIGSAGAKGHDENKPILNREEAARICGSRAGNMRAFLHTVVDGEFGGVEAYLRDLCGFTDAEIERIKKNLVVEVPEGVAPVKPVGIQGWTPDDGVLEN